MEVAVREIVHLGDRDPPIQATTIQATHRARPTVRLVLACASLAFAVLDRCEAALDHLAADAGHLRVAGEKAQRRAKKARLQNHVAVHQVDILSLRLAPAQLWPDAAAPLARIGQLHDANRQARRLRKGVVGGAAVGQDHLTAQLGDRVQGAGERPIDVRALIEGLDHDRDAHWPICCPSRAVICARLCA